MSLQNSNSNDGDVTGNHGGDDYWVVKVDYRGPHTKWQRCYGGGSQDDAYSIRQTTDGWAIS